MLIVPRQQREKCNCPGTALTAPHGRIWTSGKSLKNIYIYISVLREWILEVREVKSEMKICFTHFEKWKVKWKSGSLISRMKSEMKMPWYRDREWKVKWKCLKIEIESEKWIENASRLRSRSEISREFSRNLVICFDFCLPKSALNMVWKKCRFDFPPTLLWKM